MRAVIQRVSAATVRVEDRIVGEIGGGLVVLLGIAFTDTAAAGTWLATKIAGLRIFPDDHGVMNLSVQDSGGQVLIVSQFTLHADTRKGTRPSFHAAAPTAMAEPLYHQFVAALQQQLGPAAVATGEFGAMMQVTLTNDGPVTLIVDSPDPPST